MRSILTVLLLALVIQPALSQTSQGNWLVGGSGSFNFETYEEDNGATLERSLISVMFNPKVGSFINDGILLGGMAEFGYSKSTPIDLSSGTKITDQADVSTVYTVGPFARYYHSSNLFAEAAVGVGKRKNESFGGAAVTSENVMGWSAGVGMAFFLNDHVGIEPMLKYGSIKNTNDTSTRLFNKTSGFSLAIGLSIYLD